MSDNFFLNLIHEIFVFRVWNCVHTRKISCVISCAHTKFSCFRVSFSCVCVFHTLTPTKHDFFRVQVSGHVYYNKDLKLIKRFNICLKYFQSNCVKLKYFTLLSNDSKWLTKKISTQSTQFYMKSYWSVYEIKSSYNNHAHFIKILKAQKNQ